MNKGFLNENYIKMLDNFNGCCGMSHGFFVKGLAIPVILYQIPYLLITVISFKFIPYLFIYNVLLLAILVCLFIGIIFETTLSYANVFIYVFPVIIIINIIIFGLISFVIIILNFNVDSEGNPVKLKDKILILLYLMIYIIGISIDIFYYIITKNYIKKLNDGINTTYQER